MNKHHQFDALAIISGYQYNSGRGWFDCNEQRLVNGIPDYDSHDALQRIIDELNPQLSVAYVDHLFQITNGYEIDLQNTAFHDIVAIVEATPAQKREAILKAIYRQEGDHDTDQ